MYQTLDSSPDKSDNLRFKQMKEGGAGASFTTFMSRAFKEENTGVTDV
jgi:hypothetical protein